MKHIIEFITEKFKNNKNTKINDTYVYLIVWVDVNSNTLYKILNTNEEYQKLLKSKNLYILNETNLHQYHHCIL